MSSLFYYRLDKLFKVLRLLRFVECADKVHGSEVRASASYRLSIFSMLYELCIASPFHIPNSSLLCAASGKAPSTGRGRRA